MLADVAQRHGAEQGIADSVQHDIAIAVRQHALRAGDDHAG
jgi:hypothetical protein